MGLHGLLHLLLHVYWYGGTVILLLRSGVVLTGRYARQRRQEGRRNRKNESEGARTLRQRQCFEKCQYGLELCYPLKDASWALTSVQPQRNRPLLNVTRNCIEKTNFLTVTLYGRFEVLTAATINNAVVWDVTSCASCKNRHFGGTYRLHHQGEKNQRAKNVSSNVTRHSSETRRAIRRHILEKGILNAIWKFTTFHSTAWELSVQRNKNKRLIYSNAVREIQSRDLYATETTNT
jgi:hypothetical protein